MSDLHWLSGEEITSLGKGLEVLDFKDPVVSCKGKWYFWGPLFTTCYGPFNKESACRISLALYESSGEYLRSVVGNTFF